MKFVKIPTVSAFAQLEESYPPKRISEIGYVLLPSLNLTYQEFAPRKGTADKNIDNNINIRF